MEEGRCACTIFVFSLNKKGEKKTPIKQQHLYSALFFSRHLSPTDFLHRYICIYCLLLHENGGAKGKGICFLSLLDPIKIYLSNCIVLTRVAEIKQTDKNVCIKILTTALAGVAQWIEHQPANQRVSVQFPVRTHAWFAGQVPMLQGEHEKQPHTDVSLPLFPSPFPSL